MEQDSHSINSSITRATVFHIETVPGTLVSNQYSLTDGLRLARWSLDYLPREYHVPLEAGITQFVQDPFNAMRQPETQILIDTLHDHRHAGEYASPRFRADPLGRLHMREEISEYRNQLLPSQEKRINGAYGSIMGQPLSKDIKAYVIVPVAAGQEDDHLLQLLSRYSRQTMPSNEWALLLYVNSVGEEQVHESLIKTLRTLQPAQTLFPELPLRIAWLSYRSSPQISLIRGDAWQVAMKDIEEHAINADVIGISHDADSDYISPDYVARMQEEADKNPLKDLLTCRLGWTLIGNEKSDPNRIISYWDHISEFARRQRGTIDAFDANTAIRMSTYAAVGGYALSRYIAETLDVRTRIAAERGVKPVRRVRTEPIMHQIVHYVPDISLKTNSRRLYRGIAAGSAPDRAWTDLPFMVGMDEARLIDTYDLSQMMLSKSTIKEILNDIDEDNLGFFEDHTWQQLVNNTRALLALPPL